MATKKSNKVDDTIAAKASQMLAFAEARAKKSASWVDLHNSLFGMAGKATELFPTETERTAFSKTLECKRIFAMLDGLPQPPVRNLGELLSSANGAISVRLPHSVHAALLVEAKAEGVSLNQLCLSKLIAQLRAVV
jgi:hypothetical protein